MENGEYLFDLESTFCKDMIHDHHNVPTEGNLGYHQMLQ